MGIIILMKFNPLTILFRFDSFFDVGDTNKSGGLDLEEAKTLLPRLGFNLSVESVEENFAGYDIDGSGEIEKEECMKAISDKLFGGASIGKLPRCYGCNDWDV